MMWFIKRVAGSCKAPVLSMEETDTLHQTLFKILVI